MQSQSRFYLVSGLWSPTKIVESARMSRGSDRLLVCREWTEIGNSGGIDKAIVLMVAAEFVVVTVRVGCLVYPAHRDPMGE